MAKSVDVSFFRDNGFQVLEQVVPRTVIRRVREFLEKAVPVTLHPAMKEIGCPSDAHVVRYIRAIVERKQDGLEHLTKSTRDALCGHFSLDTRLSRELWDIPLSPEFQAAAKALLDTRRLYMHMPPTARFVLPGNVYAGVPPHQDVSYNRHMSRFVTIWVPLVPIDDECGGVSVFVGSGREPEYPVKQAKTQFWLDGVSTGNYPEHHYKLNPGDALALNPFVIHGSKPNLSNHIRLSIDFRFFGEGDRSTKHYLDLQTLEVIAPAQESTDANV